MSKKTKTHEIAFRAFNKSTGRMIYCHPGGSPSVVFIVTPEGWAFYLSDKPFRSEYCLANETDSILMRDTGQWDSNGTRIWEGDLIVDLTSEGSIGQGLQFMKASVYYKEGIFVEDYLHQPLYTYPNIEVIGNLWES